MDTKALRQKILDLAIRGKLVPQDPNDEPASVLLERIREEKKQMVKDGKLKAKDIKNDTIIFKGEDNLHYEKFQDGTVKCIEDEIPFAIPESWKWCRVRDVLSFKGGYAYKSNKYIAESCNYIIRIGNVKNNNVNPYVAQTCISDEYANETEDYKLHANDIVFTMTGTKGRRDYFFSALVSKKLINGLNLYLNQRVGCLRCIVGDTLNTSYILDCLQASFTLNAIFATETGNVNQGNIGSAATLNLLLPIPPISEQEKISQKVCDVLNKIDIYEKETFSLEILIALIKQSILDKAIRGKLVSQNVDDEPASVLLERIRAEKEELIKQGKLKRDKKESIIYKGDDNSYYEKLSDGTVKCIDEELPFDIPLSWSWERVRNLFIINPKNAVDDVISVSFIPMALLDDGYSGEYTYEEKAWKKCKKGFTHFANGDVCFAKISPCFENRKSAYFQNLCNGYGAGTTELYVLRRYTDDIMPEYLLSFVKSEYFISRGRNTFSGVVGQQRVDKEVMLDTFIPLPPSAEQVRINDMINKSFSEIANIEDGIS